MIAPSGTDTAPGNPGAGGTAAHRTSYLEFAPLPSAVRCARLHAGEVVREWGLPALAEDAGLIVSELMTNAIKASAALPERPPVAVRLLVSGTVLLIEAWDRTPLDPQAQAPDTDAEGGRGLMIVAELSRRWGTERADDHSKVVWAELAL